MHRNGICKPARTATRDCVSRFGLAPPWGWGDFIRLRAVGLQAFSRSSIFLQVVLVFEIEIATGKNQNCRSGRMVLQTPLYMSLIYSAVQGTQYCGSI